MVLLHTSHTVLLSSLVALLFLAAATDAAPGSGHLSFEDAPALDGSIAGRGGGELGTADPLAAAAGAGATVHVQKIWYETSVIHNPLGGPVRTTTGDVESEWTNFTDARFQLDRGGDLFSLLAFTVDEEGTLLSPPLAVEDLRLSAFASPLLVADEKGVNKEARNGESRVFTYEAAGDRFPLAAPHGEMGGAFSVYVADADFSIERPDDEVVTFRSGTERTEEGPTGYTERHAYHLVFFTEGTFSLAASDAIAWFDAPTFTVDGTITATRASGSILMEGDAYELDAVPVTVGGRLVFSPVPVGEPVPETDDGTLHVGTSTPSGGRYAGSSSEVSGDVTVLAIGTVVPYMDQGDLTVVAAVGVVTLAGAVLLMTPKGKWVALTLLAPFYAKTERDRLLDNESRDRIFQAIRNNPGINLSQIHRLADLGWGVTVYHLKMMEKNGLIFAESGSRDKCFFENDPKFRGLRTAIAAIANKEPAQRIARTVAADPGLTQRDVVSRTGLTQRAVSYYVGRMTREGLLEARRDGNFVRYRPAERLLEAIPFVLPEASPHAVAAGQEVGPVQA